MAKNNKSNVKSKSNTSSKNKSKSTQVKSVDTVNLDKPQKEQKSNEQSKVWWKEDSAKAVATVIAFLIIPLVLIGWIINANTDNMIGNELNKGLVKLESKKLFLNPEESDDQLSLENLFGKKSELQELPSQVLENNTDSESDENADSDDLNSQDNKSDDSTENGNNEMDVTKEQKEDVEITNVAEIIKTIDRLPNTASDTMYEVQKGDNIYRISLKVCGNDSFYLNNMRNDYLKVGSLIKVVCE